MRTLSRTDETGSPLAPPWAWGPVSRHPWFRPSDTLQSTSWAPPLDLSETAEALHVTVELAGVEPKDVEVTFENGTLTVRGEKSHEAVSGEEQGGYRRIERVYGSFARSVRVGRPVDVEQIAADFVDGVLHVVLPKTEAARPRKISVGSVDALTVEAGGKEE